MNHVDILTNLRCVNMGNLQKDYKYCQKLTKHHAKAFANTFDQVEENKRNAL